MTPDHDQLQIGDVKMWWIAASEVHRGDHVYVRVGPEDPLIYLGIACGDAQQDDELVWFTTDNDGIVDNERLQPGEHVLVVRR